MDATSAPRTIVLVEGESDRLALAAAARRLGADLDGAAVEVRSMHGITNLRRHLAALRAAGSGADAVSPRVLGLYDSNELQQVARTLADSDSDSDPEAGGAVQVPATLGGLERIGFFACVRDLEDEVIRAAGALDVELALASAGDLTRFRTFQAQPAQRERSIEAQLHRFAGTAGGRKARFAVDVIERLAIERMPRPLVALIETALQPTALVPPRKAEQG